MIVFGHQIVQANNNFNQQNHENTKRHLNFLCHLSSWHYSYNWLHNYVQEEMKLSEIKTPKKTETPYIKVVSPNGGEIWKVGEEYEIIWKSEGINPNLPVAITLIDYSKNKKYGIDTSWAKIGDGKFITSWGAAFPISVASGNKYKIRVYVNTKDITAQFPDESDDYFSIVE